MTKRTHVLLRAVLVAAAWLTFCSGSVAQETVPEAPDRAEGRGPFDRLILRGVTLVDGTGAPPRGPVDVVIEGNRIVEIRSVGYPGVPIDDDDRPAVGDSDEAMELDGHYLLPGFVDLHGHFGTRDQGVPAEYVLKLWMGHGITTSADPGSGNGLDFNVRHRERSARHEITAPRLLAYASFGQGHDGPIATPEQARAWVAGIRERGADGIKFFGLPPELMRAAIDEARQRGMRTTCHHAQLDVARLDVLDSARMGLTSMQHWYGLPEALFEDRTVQHYPLDYNYNDEQHRFENAGRLWRQAARRGSDHWNAVRDELVALDFTIVPTFHAYETTRDFMRGSRAEWHEEYTLPSLWRFYRPNRAAHASYWFDWGTEQEIAWKDNYRIWMSFIEDFKNHGGRVAVGTDSGYSYNLYGFSFVREMELLREAGFHPLELIRSATLHGAQALGVADRVGSIEVGKLADFVVIDENPVANLKVLYGIGHVRLTPDDRIERAGGVKYTIKDGIVFDARQLLADVRRMVREAKQREGFAIEPPGREGDWR